MDIGKAALDAIKVKGKLFVVQSKEVQAGGVKVMGGNEVFLRPEPKRVGGIITNAAINADAGHPGGKAIGVMVTIKCNTSFACSSLGLLVF